MSKIVKVSGGDYILSVQSGGNITLDTGSRVGLTTITGNLDVQGTVTYIESTNTTINDNVIVLNQNETNNYVTLRYSGIEVNRGTNSTYGNAQIVYDEHGTGYSDGTVAFRYTIGGTYIPLETNKITSNGDLILFPGTTSGVVTVDGTTNYENRVLSDTTLTNKKYVDDYVDYYWHTHFADRLGSGNTRVTTQETPTHEIGFILNNTLVATINNSGLTTENTLNFKNSVITNFDAGNNLKITSTNGTIQINGVLQLDDTSASPTALSGSTKVYTRNPNTTPGPGKTGIYFTSLGNSDELISRNRSLLWSMLF
jgi:hypothetical protein